MKNICSTKITFLKAKLSNGLSDVSSLKFIPGIRVSPDAMTIDEVSQQGIVITGLEKVLQKVEVSFCSFLTSLERRKSLSLFLW